MDFDLRQCYLFAHLDENQLKLVEAMAHGTRLRDGQLFFQSGDPVTHFYLVLQGQVKLTRLSLQGQEKVIEIIIPGQTFAEALMFGENQEYPVNATAIGDTHLMCFECARFMGILRGSIDTCFRLMGDMSQRLKSLIREIDELTLQSASCRVAGFLWKIWQTRQGDDSRIALQAPKGVIASRLSVTPETFSRILHNFSNQGLIHVDKGWVEVLDQNGLFEYADISGEVSRKISVS